MYKNSTKQDCHWLSGWQVFFLWRLPCWDTISVLQRVYFTSQGHVVKVPARIINYSWKYIPVNGTYNYFNYWCCNRQRGPASPHGTSWIYVYDIVRRPHPMTLPVSSSICLRDQRDFASVIRNMSCQPGCFFSSVSRSLMLMDSCQVGLRWWWSTGRCWQEAALIGDKWKLIGGKNTSGSPRGGYLTPAQIKHSLGW